MPPLQSSVMQMAILAETIDNQLGRVFGFYTLIVLFLQVLESQAPFLKSSDWFALLEGLGKQNTWTLTLEVPGIILSLTD